MASAPPKGKHAPLSPDRAFVVQVRQDGAHSPGTLSGRAEHVSSGRVAHFTSLDQLYAFISDSPESAENPDDATN